MPNPKDPEKLAAYRLKMSEIAKAKGYGQWMKGRKLSPEAVEKMRQKQILIGNQPEEKERRSQRAQNLGYGKWMQGRKLSSETVDKIAAHKKDKTYEEIYGERAQEELDKRKESLRKLKQSQPRKTDVRPKDDFACQVCKKRGGQLQAHHIEQWSKRPDLRYEISNGMMVCAVPCHQEITRQQRLKKPARPTNK